MFRHLSDYLPSSLFWSCLFVCCLLDSFTSANDARAICQERFARYSRSHTACAPPSSSCQILSRGLEENAQQLILDVHNQYRAHIASGNESRLGFPGASNMLKLEWDHELAYVAQAHADQCKFEHDCYDCRRTGKFKVVGQNLYVYQTSRNAQSLRQDWKGIIKEWYDEIKIAPPSVARSFNLHELNIGHFTQMAWASTNKVGCGAVTYDISNEPAEGGYGPSPFKTAILYTCNYAPGGNFLGEKMYRIGSPASQCPKKHRPSSELPTLCELTSSTSTSVTSTSSRVNITTSQVTSHRTSTNNGNINNQVTNIVRKKIVTTRKKTKKITKKINSGGRRYTTSTTTTITTSNAARPKILVNISTPKPTIINWTASPPVSIVQPPIIVPTAKPVLHIPDTQPTLPVQEQPVPSPTYNGNNDIVPEYVPVPPPEIVAPPPTTTTTTTTTSTTTTTTSTTTPRPAVIIEDNNIPEIVPFFPTTRSPVTIRPFNSGGTQLVAAVAPWWKKWIVSSSTRKPTTRTRFLVATSINRTPFSNSINKWPGSVTNTNVNRKPTYSPIPTKPANSASSSWNSPLFASSSTQVPRVAHWSSQNLYFLTHNFTNNGFPRPFTFTQLPSFNGNSIGGGENARFSRFTVGRS